MGDEMAIDTRPMTAGRASAALDEVVLGLRELSDQLIELRGFLTPRVYKTAISSGMGRRRADDFVVSALARFSELRAQLERAETTAKGLAVYLDEVGTATIWIAGDR